MPNNVTASLATSAPTIASSSSRSQGIIPDNNFSRTAKTIARYGCFFTSSVAVGGMAATALGAVVGTIDALCKQSDVAEDAGSTALTSGIIGSSCIAIGMTAYGIMKLCVSSCRRWPGPTGDSPSSPSRNIRFHPASSSYPPLPSYEEISEMPSLSTILPSPYTANDRRI